MQTLTALLMLILDYQKPLGKGPFPSPISAPLTTERRALRTREFPPEKPAHKRECGGIVSTSRDAKS